MCHVLIIEDDDVIAVQIAKVIAVAGASSIMIAATQAAAVASALRHRPRLILSDVRLPEGSGSGAVQTIVAALGPVPVIFITGSPDECEPHMAATILRKPFIPRMLIAAVRGYVGA
jgi:CheY-like chemotaxis protein